jgi:putative glycosyltransferase (TIGR04348 family)
MRIAIVTPAAPGSRHGNRNTAERWSRHLRRLDHRTEVMVDWDGRDADLMIALHARRSHAAIKAWRARYPQRPLVLVLTGTDLYRDIRSDPDAQESLELADRMVVLQARGLDELEAAHRAKTRVIFQSVAAHRRQAAPSGYFLVTVIGHLREEKDPFRSALALAHLPAGGKIRVVHLGKAMSGEFEIQARDLMQKESRYRWLGERDHSGAMRWLARSHVMVISSLMEGGAHVVSEAIATGVPVIASAIPGNVGLLGEDYPGYYRVGDEKALAALMSRAHHDDGWLGSLQNAIGKRRDLVSAETERRSLQMLLGELAGSGIGGN